MNSQRTPEQEAEFLRGKREELSAAQDELQRAEDTLQKMEAKLEGFERVKAEAERRGADDKELADIEAREQALTEKAERGRVWIPERREQLQDAERAIESRERSLQQDRGQGREDEPSPDATPDGPPDTGADTNGQDRGRDEGGTTLRADPQVLDARRASLDMREKKLDEREAAVAARERTLDTREAELSRQEDRLNARERATGPEPGPDTPEPTESRTAQKKDGLGHLQDGEEVAAYQRLRHQGMSVEFARAEVIEGRKDGPDRGAGEGEKARGHLRAVEDEPSPEPSPEASADAPESNGQNARREAVARGEKGAGEGVSVKEAAKQIGIAESTVRRFVQRGELQAEKDDRGRLKVQVPEASHEREI